MKKLPKKSYQIIYTTMMLSLTVLLCVLWGGIPQMQDKGESSSETLLIGAVFPRSVDTWNDSLLADITRHAAEGNLRMRTVLTNLKLSEQIDAMRAFILNDVDFILLNPVTSSGWDDIFTQAANAGIPVLVVDHILSLAPETDASLVYQISFDYQSAAQALAASSLASLPQGDAVETLVLAGNVSSAFSKRINTGLRAGFSQTEQAVQLYNSTCNEMQSKAEENVQSLLRNGYRFQMVYAHNSAMALGAIKTLKQFGLVPGADSRVFAFGGGADIKEALQSGELSGYVDCDTNAMASKLMELITALLAGDTSQPQEIRIPCQLVFTEGS